MPKRRAFTKRRKEAFLAKFRETGNVSEAAREIEMSRGYMYELRNGSKNPDGTVKKPPVPGFAAEWDEAEQDYLEECEKELKRRAYDGVKRLKEKRKLVTDENGKEMVVEITREATTYHSDTLLQFHLSSRHPDYQKASKLEVSGPDGEAIPIRPTSGIDWSLLSYEEKAAMRELLDKATPPEDESASAGPEG